MIPRWAMLKTDGVPDQCLSLPPSLSAGVPYRRPGEDCEYAQPNIIYRLRARVQLNSHQDSMLIAGAEASKTIVILPYSPPMPPTDTSDFPAEFISSASNTYRMFLVGSWYVMTLSMVEPAAICLQDTQTRGSVNAMIHVEIKASGGVMDATSVKKVPHGLKNLIFKTQPLLRVKTFYSTEPFRKLPGQTMLSLNGPMRLKDQVVKLEAQDLKASSWQHDRPDEAYSSADVDRRSPTSARSANVSTVGSGKESGALFTAEDSPQLWWTRLLMPIAVLPNLPPTFCSVTASRQYSVITRIRVGGIRINKFVLEVPLQIVYAPRGGQEQSSTFSTQKLQPSFRSTSQLEEMLHEMDVSYTFCSCPCRGDVRAELTNVLRSIQTKTFQITHNQLLEFGSLRLAYGGIEFWRSREGKSQRSTNE